MTTTGTTALAALVACAASMLSCGEDSHAIVLTEADTGAEILLASGDQFEVRLDANPSTGYAWTPDVGSVESFVDIGRARYEPHEHDDRLGGTGIEVFEVDVLDAGSGVLRFEYVRPFEDAPIPERIVEYALRVDGHPWPPEPRPPAPVVSIATSPSADATQEITGLLASGKPGSVVVSGFVIWDATSALLCELLLESAPPQCGGASIVITDPERLQRMLGIDFDELGGVRWTANRIEIRARFDGRSLTIGG